MNTTTENILHFWFVEHGRKEWFCGGVAFDELIIERFGTVHKRAVAGELFTWRSNPRGRLAEIIILDQFSRQIYRKQARAFAADPMALTLSQEMVFRGDDQVLELEEKRFVYMPYMHSESLAIQDEALRLFKIFGDDTMKYVHQHRDMIKKFNRYPYRNAVLGRKNTPAEEAFLSAGHSSYGQ